MYRSSLSIYVSLQVSSLPLGTAPAAACVGGWFVLTKTKVCVLRKSATVRVSLGTEPHAHFVVHPVIVLQFVLPVRVVRCYLYVECLVVSRRRRWPPVIYSQHKVRTRARARVTETNKSYRSIERAID